MGTVIFCAMALVLLQGQLQQPLEYQTREALLQHLEAIRHPRPPEARGAGSTGGARGGDPHARMDADKDGCLTRAEWEAFMILHDEDYLPCHRDHGQP